MMRKHARPARSFRVGILGAGFISDLHIAALKTLPFVEVCAVCDQASGKAALTGERWNIPQVYSSLREMLEKSSLDVIHILLPPDRHFEAALACLEAGVDIFLEKPLATSSEECETLVRTSSRLERRAGVNHNARYHPALERLKTAIRAWRLGRVQHVAATINLPLRQLSQGQHDHWMFRDPGNIVLEQAPHPLSQIQLLVGNVESVSALASGRRLLNTGQPFYSTWQISMGCERGSAQCSLSFGGGFPVSTLQVIGEDAAAFVDLRTNRVQISEQTRFLEPVDHLLDGVRNGLGAMRQSAGNFVDYGLSFLKLKAPNDPFFAGIRGSIRGFYEALREGSVLPVNLEQASAVITACERIVHSAGGERLNHTDIAREIAHAG